MMTKKNEFDCTGIVDRTAVNDFITHVVRGLRQKAFRLTSERKPDGSFEIRITGDGSAPGANQKPPKPSRKRAAIAADAGTIESDDTTTTAECCQPE